MNYWEFIQRLKATGIEQTEAQAMARVIADKVLNISFADMLCASVLDIPENIIKGLANGQPLQYLIGKEDFYGREFEVGKGVLIPRPETEELCQWVIESAANEKSESPKRILDIGTGSGAIAVTLALEIPEAEVYAMDISEEAIAYAQQNAERLGAKVTFLKEDILQVASNHTTHTTTTNTPAKYSVIVSNPPYILNKERAKMENRVLDNEPQIALFVPDDSPLLFYRAIADFASENLINGGELLFEINPLCADEMLTLLHEKGFSDIQLRKDQFGKQRMIKATKP